MVCGRLFDRVVVVDWSASATPKQGPDSIWIAVVDGDSCIVSNPPTRHEAIDSLVELSQSSRRTLIGVDFSLGYPRGTAAALGLTGRPWTAIWDRLADSITDDDANRNNRFDVADELNVVIQRTGRSSGVPTSGPFWGCPPRRATAALTTTKPTKSADWPSDWSSGSSSGSSSGWPPGWPSEWRAVESELRASGHQPFSAWQLLGAGAVGSQSLVGIAWLERFRRQLGERVAVWPFTTGLTAPTDADADVVLAEVWPSLWPVEVPVGTVKDAAQVEATARRLHSLDGAGALEALFAPSVGAEFESAVIDEEGWVLGVAGTAGAPTAGTAP